MATIHFSPFADFPFIPFFSPATRGLVLSIHTFTWQSRTNSSLIDSIHANAFTQTRKYWPPIPRPSVALLGAWLIFLIFHVFWRPVLVLVPGKVIRGVPWRILAKNISRFFSTSRSPCFEGYHLKRWDYATNSPTCIGCCAHDIFTGNQSPEFLMM